MARLLEQHEGQELHEGDMSVQEASTLDQSPLTVPEEWLRDHPVTTREQRRPIRWMRWLAFAGVLAGGAIVAVLATTGDSNEVVAQPEPIGMPIVRTVDRWELGLNPPVMPVVLRTVDNWEIGLNPPAVLVMPNADQIATPVQPAVEGDWDHLLVPPAAEGDWDHLLLPPAAEGDWDHQWLPPAAEGDWDHLLIVID